MAFSLNNLTFGLELEGYLIHKPGFAYDVIKSRNGRLRATGHPENVLQLAEHLIKGNGVDIRRHWPGQRLQSYTGWQVMAEVPDGSLNISQYLALHGIDDSDASKWAAGMIEIVSPPYLINDLPQAMECLDRILASLRTEETVLAVTPTCGLHVHIGQKDGSRFPLHLLQNLAYTTALYEHEAMKLHDPARLINKDILPNRIAYGLWEDDEKPGLRETSGMDMESASYSVEAIYQQIFDPEIQDQERFLNFAVFSDKNCAINWENCANDEYKSRAATVEFRQKGATTKVAEIQAWIEFCAGLVKRSHSHTLPDCVSRIRNWEHAIDLRNLLDEIDMDDGGRAHLKELHEANCGKQYPSELGIWRVVMEEGQCAPEWTYGTEESRELERNFWRWAD